MTEDLYEGVHDQWLKRSREKRLERDRFIEAKRRMTLEEYQALPGGDGGGDLLLMLPGERRKGGTLLLHSGIRSTVYICCNDGRVVLREVIFRVKAASMRRYQHKAVGAVIRDGKMHLGEITHEEYLEATGWRDPL